METSRNSDNVVDDQQDEQQHLLVSASAATMQSRSRSRAGRVVFGPQQLAVLEQHFRRQKFLNKEDRQHLATQLALTDRQVLIWFQNRRGRLKRLGPADKAYTPATSMSSSVSLHLSHPHSQPRYVYPNVTPARIQSLDVTHLSNAGTIPSNPSAYFNFSGSAVSRNHVQHFSHQHDHRTPLQCYRPNDDHSASRSLLYDGAGCRYANMMNSPFNYFNNSAPCNATDSNTANTWCYYSDAKTSSCYIRPYSLSSTSISASSKLNFNDLSSNTFGHPSYLFNRSPVSLSPQVQQRSDCMYNQPYLQPDQHHSVNVLHYPFQSFATMSMPNYASSPRQCRPPVST